MCTLWRDLCHILSSLSKTPWRKLGRILAWEHLFGSRNCDLKLKEKKQHLSNFSSRNAFVCISLVQTHSVCSGETDVSCRSSPPSRGVGAVHHAWLVNKQRISASTSQIHPFTGRTFFLWLREQNAHYSVFSVSPGFNISRSSSPQHSTL